MAHMSGGYAVIDVETTGFSPRTDRIVEIALVRVSPAGILESVWSTLLNPGRDPGPTHIHGISAEDVAEAPTFADIADWLVDQMRSRVIVAHNAAFDLRFLAAELSRCGYRVDSSAIPRIDTQWAVTRIADPDSRKLADCCAALDVTLTDAHTAQADTLATAELLVHCLRRCQAMPEWRDQINAARTFAWPAAPQPVTDAPPALSRAGEDLPVDLAVWQEGLVSAMSTLVTQIHATDAEQQYLAALVEALADQAITLAETSLIDALARRAGMRADEQARLNRLFLGALAQVAVRDAIVTPAEVTVLEDVARLLGFPAERALAALDFAASHRDPGERRGAHAHGSAVGTRFDEEATTRAWGEAD